MEKHLHLEKKTEQLLLSAVIASDTKKLNRQNELSCQEHTSLRVQSNVLLGFFCILLRKIQMSKNRHRRKGEFYNVTYKKITESNGID